MLPVPILAHGALGPFDELIFAGVGVIFLIMMGISWVRARSLPPDDEPDDLTVTPISERGDHFRLD